MASPSESRKVTSDDTEVTSEQRSPEAHHEREKARELDLEFSLTRQSSIYSLTLDEIQNTVCEPGKTFGSMNMDEFLTNIWNVEEGQNAGGGGGAPDSQWANGGPPATSLHRQGSLTLPAPLGRKTVDEVWAEIHHRDGSDGGPGREADHGGAHDGGSGNAGRQQTLGEMTLEDFLIKAGVVKEGGGGGGGGSSHSAAPSQHAPPVATAAAGPTYQQQYGLPAYGMAPVEGTGFGHVVGVGYGDHHHQGMGPTVNSVYPVVGDGGGGAGAYGFGGRMGNGYGGAGGVARSPASPGSEERMGGGVVDNSAAVVEACGGRGANGSGGGRKRLPDGAVEKVVERRQRRMIKNRESAARSRARKQAYTVELEAELNMLKEENARLKDEERRVLALRKQMLLQAMAEQSRVNAAVKNARMLRRCNSCPW